MTGLLWLAGFGACVVLWVLCVLVAAAIFLELVRGLRAGR